MIHITRISSKVYFMIYLFGSIFLLMNHKNQLLFFWLGPSISFVIGKYLRYKIKRKRPFVTLAIKTHIAHQANGSLPSMHSVSATAIGVAILLEFGPIGIVFIMLAFLTGLSRVMVGVHYPLDILFGGIIGGIVTYCVMSLYK
ncbi:phosphatase PAP2 family protein [Natranaerovirga hydrolytica]|nr:phosphatase PAP2 family protein [Natranaerovirga hydrolytica]